MDEDEFEAKLANAFPQLYVDMWGDKRATCMYWGIETGAGWQKLIWELSDKLSTCIDKMPEEQKVNCKARQVKEKFGGLRFYIQGETKEMEKLIEEAEALSLETCEDCGEPGKPNDKGWIRTQCSSCVAALEARAKHNQLLGD